MLGKESQGAFTRQFGRGFLVGTSVVAIETVVGFIQLHLHLGLCFFEVFHRFHRNPMVLRGEVRQHRAMGRAFDFSFAGGAAPVIRHGRAHAFDQGRRAPGEQSTPAVTHHPHFATASDVGVVYRGLNVSDHAGGGQIFNSRFECHARLHVFWCVAQLYAGFGAMEHGWGNGQITGGGIAIGHFANVGVDAKNFLQYQHRCFGRMFGGCHVGGKLKTVGGCESNGHESTLLSGLRQRACNGCKLVLWVTVILSFACYRAAQSC